MIIFGKKFTMASYTRKIVGKSDRYRGVFLMRDGRGNLVWVTQMNNMDRGYYESEHEAAVAVDKVLIRRGKAPVNVLRRVCDGQK